MKTPTKKSARANRPKRLPAATTRTVLATTSERPVAPRGLASKWRWHYQTLLALRDRLRQRRGGHIGAASEPLEPHSMDLADAATDEFDHDLALSQLSAGQDAFYEVEEALKRIVNRTYGVCEETGRPIPRARLRAIPWTRFTRDVEARLEGKGALHRPHLGTLNSVRGEGRGDLGGSETEEEQLPPPAEDESLHETPPLEVNLRSKGSGAARKRTARK